MKALLIQHTAVDTPGIMMDLLDELEIDTSVIRIDQGQEIPTCDQADVLMSFGGPVSLHLADVPKWVEQEKKLMRRFLDEGKRVVGICLGSQLLASTLGANIKRNGQAEVGWHLIKKVDSETLSAGTMDLGKHLPEQAVVLHWHQNTFELPEGATHLYQSAGCSHQAFALRDRALGIQFHPEVIEKTIRYYLQVSPMWRMPGDHVQDRAFIEAGIANFLIPQQGWFKRFMTDWLQTNPPVSGGASGRSPV